MLLEKVLAPRPSAAGRVACSAFGWDLRTCGESMDFEIMLS